MPAVSLVSVTLPLGVDDVPLLTVAVQVVEAPTVSEAGWQPTVVVVGAMAVAGSAQNPISASVAPSTFIADAGVTVPRLCASSRGAVKPRCQSPFGWRTT